VRGYFDSVSTIQRHVRVDDRRPRRVRRGDDADLREHAAHGRVVQAGLRVDRADLPQLSVVQP
jgi:transposase InsO family protein